MDLRPEGVLVVGVLEGSAAQRDGLKAGDTILEIGGKPVGDDPLRLLDPYLSTGKAIPFLLERGGSKVRITVKPDPR
jgi:S1-C subfamily serine protease